MFTKSSNLQQYFRDIVDGENPANHQGWVFYPIIYKGKITIQTVGWALGISEPTTVFHQFVIWSQELTIW